MHLACMSGAPSPTAYPGTAAIPRPCQRPPQRLQSTCAGALGAHRATCSKDKRAWTTHPSPVFVRPIVETNIYSGRKDVFGFITFQIFNFASTPAATADDWRPARPTLLNVRRCTDFWVAYLARVLFRRAQCENKSLLLLGGRYGVQGYHRVSTGYPGC